MIGGKGLFELENVFAEFPLTLWNEVHWRGEFHVINYWDFLEILRLTVGSKNKMKFGFSCDFKNDYYVSQNGDNIVAKFSTKKYSDVVFS